MHKTAYLDVWLGGNAGVQRPLLFAEEEAKKST